MRGSQIIVQMQKSPVKLQEVHSFWKITNLKKKYRNKPLNSIWVFKKSVSVVADFTENGQILDYGLRCFLLDKK